MALLALAVFAGCQNPAPGYTPVPPPPVEPVSTKDVRKSTDLMPLDEGNRWIYTLRMESVEGRKPLGAGEDTVVYRVESIEPNGDAVMVLEQGGRVLDRQGWRSNENGLYQTTSGANQFPYSPAQPIALLPLTTGKKFGWKGKGVMSDGTVGFGTSESEVLPPQNVDTKMGSLSAIPVLSHTTFKTGRNASTSWFKPGVGLVRLRQETASPNGRRDVMLLTLTNYALKK